MNETQVLSILERHIPEQAIDYCVLLWKEKPFRLHTTKSRQTKIGDFTCKRGGAARITVNEDLNPYLFLVTYIHEVAHHYVHHQVGNRVEPHGRLWQQTFANLLQPVLSPEVFPERILHLLSRHMRQPMASTFADVALTKAFRDYDHNAHTHIVLSSLAEGSIFQLNGRTFKKGKLRRTRFLCAEVKSKRQYLVPAEALVNNVQLSLELI
ncbi:MAG: SprT-like domain-containing protein [Cyclobacteriaceae bacterium]|nr:SprT-like domain-containing protein [Cyclobacteriaceae bacterium]UYN86615.1 MAG: SprT-like domain-containing protein [Cyclobacteriaceae bacterium]